MKRFFLILAMVLLPGVLYAQSAMPRPDWSLEIKGGLFFPDINDWSRFYGSRHTPELGGALAYKIIRQIEVGIEADYSRAGGSGFAPFHNQTAGHVIYNLYPLDVYILGRAIFTEDQWLVPYAGGGFTKMFYREEVEDQGVVRGSVRGTHARAGIQFLLDVLDPSAANSFYHDIGVKHSYLFLEGKYTRAMIDTVGTATAPSQSVNLGGTSWLAGLLFEF